MTDPHRTDRLPTAGDVPDRERDARAEDLLLTGLDHYFLGQYELAISVWTRVLFLDRGHARARAYIERARRAIAERQRESEELLHTGAAAFQRGDAGAARRLLTSAVERGAASEEAVVLLERLDRLENVHARVEQELVARAGRPPLPDTTSNTPDSGSQSRVAWIATGVFAGIAVAALAAVLSTGANGWWMANEPLPTPAAGPPRPEPLPIPSSAEAALTRAERLHSGGRLHEALDILSGIRHGDPLRPRADALRAAIQRQLLESAGGIQAPVSTAGQAPSSPPK
jgi:tetratricopeptide (TPR) repeat protein